MLAKSFCDPKAASDLNKPFNIEENTWATNRHAAICIPELADFPINTNQRVANILETCIQKQSQLSYSNLSDWVKPKLRKCPDCKETGKCKEIECEECQGVGNLVFSSSMNQYSVKCKNCVGKGMKIILDALCICEMCHGTGKKVSGSGIVRFKELDVDINYYYLILIENLAGLKVASHPKSESTNGNPSTLYFKFNQGFGLILGMI